MMTIAILYICTGKYNQFFEGFYNSCEKNLLPKAVKSYYVWTDDDNLGEGKGNVNIIHKECAGFPADSLFRFEYFLQVEKELEKYDYIYFFNANAEVRQQVGEEFLPDETGLAMGLWYNQEKSWWNPWRIFDLPAFFTYERNKNSLAYIPPLGKNYKNFMGGVNGGRSKEYLEMIRTLAKNIRDDYDRGIVAIAHDQSHINAYMRSHECKIIPREYCWPEEWNADFSPKIVFRDKRVLGGVFIKGRNPSIWGKMKRNIKRIHHAISWYI